MGITRAEVPVLASKSTGLGFGNGCWIGWYFVLVSSKLGCVQETRVSSGLLCSLFWYFCVTQHLEYGVVNGFGTVID